MASAKKFGTFGGVFTPSILTILGVIMYLRLPWIVGEAGLYNTFLIIAIAHIISFTTGLSVASIATDKKVRTGGTYFMISRSLGLAIGGTLGLALFVGLSLSVSLYLIGFSESFLNYFGWETSLQNIRIAGSLALLLVTIITFISTSLAIKSQYLIMTAILLSLVSILFGNHDFAPEAPLLGPSGSAIPFMVLFGIFFPAVTGFEAGVSMSGDLEDPKKSIPSGTITAIIIGLVVYFALATFFAFNVDRGLLTGDSQVLQKIAWIPVLVVAGIWGATMSSALGSILGAPRILQATAIDKITPRIFAKGYGPTEEPRNALLLTFVIAEAGILIGELDVIARVVSMFFITTYGFLNLTAAIESWSGSDFRPEFKIPRWVSLFGSIACFLVMIQLDFAALVGASIILGLVFLYLKQRELNLSGGDTWGGFWSSLAVSSIKKLRSRKDSARNWRPNIIMFNGKQDDRPYLVKFGKDLSGKLGVITNFRLEEDPNLPAPIKKLPDPTDSPEIFTRAFACRNLYEGIDVVANTFGFSGLEPNTILMGWAKNTREPQNFVRLIKRFEEQKLQTVFLHYDPERKFGNRKRIQVWWNGRDNMIHFALSLMRFLLSSPEWNSAMVFVYVIVDTGSAMNLVDRSIRQIMENYRIPYRVKIINNSLEKREYPDLILAESGRSDLTILGITDKLFQRPEEYLQRISRLHSGLGSTLMLRPNSDFETIDLLKIFEVGETKRETLELSPLYQSERHPVLSRMIENLDQQLKETAEQFHQASLEVVINAQLELLNETERLFNQGTRLLNQQLKQNERARRTRLFYKIYNEFLYQTQSRSRNSKLMKLLEEGKLLPSALDNLQSRLLKLTDGLPKRQVVLWEKQDFRSRENDSGSIRWYKFWKRQGSKSVAVNLRLKESAAFYLQDQALSGLNGLLDRFYQDNLSFWADFRKILIACLESFENIQPAILDEQISETLMEQELSRIGNLIQDQANKLKQQQEQYFLSLNQSFRFQINQMSAEIDNPVANMIIRKHKLTISQRRQQQENLHQYGNIWHKNQQLISGSLGIDLRLYLLKNRIRVHLNKMFDQLDKTTSRFSTQVIAPFISSNQQLTGTSFKVASPDAPIYQQIETELQEIAGREYEAVRESFAELPEEALVTPDLHSSNAEGLKLSSLEEVLIPLRSLVEYQLENRFLGQLQKMITQITSEIREIKSKIEEAVKLLRYHFEGDTLWIDTDGVEDSQTLIRSVNQELSRLQKNLDQQNITLKENLVRTLTTTFDSVNSYSIIHSSREIPQKQREAKSRMVFFRFRYLGTRLNQLVYQQLSKILYSRSEGILLTRKIRENQEQEAASQYDLMSYVESRLPERKVLDQLPQYYKNLFAGKSITGDEFWVGRQQELQVAENTVRRFKAGQPGGLLVVGPRRSGRTSFLRKIAYRHFDQNQVFLVNAVHHWGADHQQFHQILQTATMRNGTPAEILNDLPFPSALVIDDLEHWWERTPDGNSLIMEILDLMQQFGHRIFFLLDCNYLTWNFLKKLSAVQQYFAATIELQPFGAEDLKNAIMLRHRSSGLKLMYRNQPEESMSPWKLAALFNDYFNLSRGNIGVALHSWLSGIREVKEQRLLIDRPLKNNDQLLEKIDDNWTIYLLMFLLHGKLHPDGMVDLTGQSEPEVNAVLSSLKRTGLLEEAGAGYYQINHFLEPLIQEKFLDKEII